MMVTNYIRYKKSIFNHFKQVNISYLIAKSMFGLIRLYVISTIVGYLMLNPFLYIYTEYMISKYIL